MGKIYRMSDNEKKLLHTIGEHPEMSTKELLEHTNYKWERTIKRKIKQLKGQPMLYGPYYDINYSKLCTNPLHKLYCILELDIDQNYETVIPYLKVIEPLRFIFPILSSHKRLLTAGFFSSDNAAMITIFDMLKKNGIITDYIVRVFRSKRLIENPNLFGDPNPKLDTLLNPCDIPDMSLDPHDTMWNECDLSILPYLERGTKLIDIIREEKKAQRTWTYEQAKYSRKKMVKHDLIKKRYVFDPFPPGQCVEFRLFFKTKDAAFIPRILYNFARGERLLKGYALVKELGDKPCSLGSINCTSHPLFLKDLMHKLDRIDEIKEKEIYTMRSFPPEENYSFGRPIDLKYFDFETQTLEYPYHVYEEKIKERIEGEVILL
ncbi:MAG: hypothetical protein HXS48_20295 [Theionarchaea archaeon]|nr:hypothetical protein [Theionarchaea archaeon]